jgi:hypothetical protein
MHSHAAFPTLQMRCNRGSNVTYSPRLGVWAGTDAPDAHFQTDS